MNRKRINVPLWDLQSSPLKCMYNPAPNSLGSSYLYALTLGNFMRKGRQGTGRYNNETKQDTDFALGSLYELLYTE